MIMKFSSGVPRINALGQPIGDPVSGWSPPPLPPRQRLSGHSCVVDPIDPQRHATALFDAISTDGENRMWTYLSYGPFDSDEHYAAWLRHVACGEDPMFFAIVDRHAARAVGVAAYLRMDRQNGVIEIGHLAFSPLLQRQVAATEAVYLMIRRTFELGYRRCEWKCDALNSASRAAAMRFGFVFEGIFRQAMIYKGRNRDTAWYSIIDRDWPALDVAYQCWLDPANFDEHGHQRMSLSSMTAGEPHRVTDRGKEPGK
jgi:RimJ/RimL family protein N-acetyltransferase